MSDTATVTSATTVPEFVVEVYYEAPAGLTPADEAMLQQRIELARAAAELVLQGGPGTIPKMMTADVETAIAEVLEARRRLSGLQPRGTTMQSMLLRRQLFDAVDALGALFDEEKPDV